MSNEEKGRPQWGFEKQGFAPQGFGKQGFEKQGLRFDTTPETDTNLHPAEQDCPRAYRRSFKL